MAIATPVPGISAILHARAVMLGAPMRPTDDALGRTFVYWLSQACLLARKEAGLNQTDIPMVQSRVSRFEKNAKWPDDPEGLVQAYGQALGLRDSRVLWEFALDLWLEHGQPPTPVEPRRVPGIPEGQLLQRLREALPNDQDPGQRTTSRATRRSGDG